MPLGKYSISVVAEITGMHQQTIRTYERQGLIKPQRSSGGTRYFSDEDVEQLRAIAHLTQDMGVNLAGVEIIFRMREREGQLMELLRRLMEHMSADDGERQQIADELRRNDPGKALARVFERGITHRPK